MIYISKVISLSMAVILLADCWIVKLLIPLSLKGSTSTKNSKSLLLKAFANAKSCGVRINALEGRDEFGR